MELDSRYVEVFKESYARYFKIARLHQRTKSSGSLDVMRQTVDRIYKAYIAYVVESRQEDFGDVFEWWTNCENKDKEIEWETLVHGSYVCHRTVEFPTNTPDYAIVRDRYDDGHYTETRYVCGIKNGRYIEYDIQGNIQSESLYENGELVR
jgi:hypothetical protein